MNYEHCVGLSCCTIRETQKRKVYTCSHSSVVIHCVCAKKRKDFLSLISFDTKKEKKKTKNMHIVSTLTSPILIYLNKCFFSVLHCHCSTWIEIFTGRRRRKNKIHLNRMKWTTLLNKRKKILLLSKYKHKQSFLV